jgi:hypothetical protein
MPIPPNKIKYPASYDGKSIKVDNFSIGVNRDSDYGPTSLTGYWNTIEPVASGYTVYIERASGGPVIYTPQDDSGLVFMANYLAGSIVANNVTEALSWFHLQNDKFVANIDYPDIVSDGLVFCVDAGYVVSYPRSGATWTDLSYSGHSATLINTPSFSLSGGGSLYFSSASQEYATIPEIGTLSNFTIDAWVYFKSLPTSNTYPAIVTNVYPGGSNVGYALGVLNAPWDGKITGGFFNNGWKISSGFTPVVNTWYHFATTYDGTDVKFYKDGALYSQNAVGSSSVSSGAGGYIARRWDDPNFIDGEIPSVKIYNRALDVAEVLQNYDALKSRYMGTILYNELDGLAAYLRNYMSEFRNPNFYNYWSDGTSIYISDGGSDMYDGGNFTTPWLLSNVTYTSNASSPASYPFAVSYANTGTTTADTSFYYVSLGYKQYGPPQDPIYHPMTVLGTRGTEGHAVGWQIGGNSGADGGGLLSSGLIYNGADISGFTTYAFYRETYNTSDPSHCNLYILLGHSNWGSTFGTINTLAPPVNPDTCGGYMYTSGSTVKNILAIQTLLSKSSGALVTSGECQTVVQNFVNRIKLHFGY